MAVEVQRLENLNSEMKIYLQAEVGELTEQLRAAENEVS